MTWKIRIIGTSIGLAVAALLIGGAILSGCGASHSSAPEPTAANTSPGTREAVMQFPDGFRNVAFECHGPVGVYVSSRGQTTDAITSGLSTVPDDPACK